MRRIVPTAENDAGMTNELNERKKKDIHEKIEK
jgi:hypothetical protein